MNGRPTLALDLFSDEAICDPYPLHRAIRDHAPAVWLSAHGVWAIGRYQDARAALRADGALVSGRGVTLNDFLNAQPGRSVLTSDGDLHRRRRAVVMKPMTPRALAEVETRIQALAVVLTEELLARDSFDGIADFARHLPVAVVSHLVGLPEEGRERMLDWGAAAFDASGPGNARAQVAALVLLGRIEYVLGVERASLPPDGWAKRVFQSADEGKLDAEDVRGLLTDYILPSLDTTIVGAGHLLYALGAHPLQYDLVRANPALIPAAVDEALRFGSPVRGFTRYALTRYETDALTIPEESSDHLAFGYGVHRCAGAYLAELELASLLRAMVARVARIELGAPRMLMSNMLYGYQRFPVTFHR